MAIFPTNDATYRATYAEEAAMVDASELIAAALLSSGMTRSELATKLDVSKSEITARLRGERNITVRKLAATLHALGAELQMATKPAPKINQRSEIFREWIEQRRGERADDRESHFLDSERSNFTGYRRRVLTR